jgi:hypothetical protein
VPWSAAGRGQALTLHATTARLGELVPREGLRQLEAALEEIRRRARNGGRAQREMFIRLEFDEATGDVVAVEIPRRYDWT